MKKRTLLSVIFLAGSLLSTGAIVSCSKTETSQTSQTTEKVSEKTVIFKIQDENGEWKNYVEPQVIKDGKVSLPANPNKTYYTFRGWFLDTGWVKEFKNEDLTEGVVVYAYFVADEVNIVINGESQGTRDLIDVVNGTYNPGEGLTFDGWYTDANCKVKYKEGDPAKTLYAQSVATITFNNGYEDCYVTKIKPDTLLMNPSLDTLEIDGVKTTIEENKIVKSYMSNEDISYLDENGNEIDFSKAISKNMTIKVAWKSPFLKYEMCDNESGNQILLCLGTYGNLNGSDVSKAKLEDVPVISFPSKVTLMDKDGNKTVHDVKGAYVFDNKIFDSTALKKVVVQEGVKFIRGFSSTSGTSSVHEISLPSSLRIMQDCFNNMNLTKDSVKIPEHVEAIYDCFFKGATVNYNDESLTFYTGTSYDFDIAIPDSVKSLSIVPLNFRFSSKSSFKNDGKMITQTTDKGKVLISYNEIDEHGVIKVPEGIQGIQVGTFVNRTDLKKLVLPKTFSFVNYNLPLTDFQDCYGWYQGSYTCHECYLYSSTLSDNDFAYNARLVVSNLDTMTYLVFQGDVSEEVYKAFAGNASTWAYATGSFTACNDEVYQDIQTISLKETSTPKVKVNFHDAYSERTYTATIDRTNQNAITYDEILTALDNSNSTSYKSLIDANKMKITETLNMLEDYNMSSAVKMNLYLDITADYSIEKAGVMYAVENNEVTITGFDQETAIQLGTDSYGIIIPDTIDNKKVTSIKEGAFKEKGNIEVVRLGKNITSIGKNAFNSAISLKKVDFNDAKLVSIGEGAFEDTALTSLSFSIASLKSVGDSAFKISTLQKFIPVNGEESRDVRNVQNGEFYFVPYQAINENWTALITSYLILNQKVRSSVDSEKNVTTYDVKMYAFANNSGIDEIKIGEDHSADGYLVRYEVMKGAMTGLAFSSSVHLDLILVSKIHSNAISDTTITRKGIRYDATNLGITTTVSTIENLVTALPDVFEANWIDNYDSIKSVKVASL